jgi:putative restriction endonuclease
MHWMFDRGVISLSDDYDIMLAKNRVPDDIKQLMNPGGKINFPVDSRFYPHPQFLKYHREHIFLG